MSFFYAYLRAIIMPYGLQVNQENGFLANPCTTVKIKRLLLRTAFTYMNKQIFLLIPPGPEIANNISCCAPKIHLNRKIAFHKPGYRNAENSNIQSRISRHNLLGE
jgi:hypothetical protein